MTAPLHRILIEAMRRPRRAEEPPRPAAPAPARPAPALADGREPRRAPSDTFRQAVAAAKGDDDSRPRRRQAPYMVAAAILDERADAGTLTPAQLVEAMAERGVTISQSTAQALLRELRSPLSTRLSNRRPARAAGTLAGDASRPAARPSQ